MSVFGLHRARADQINANASSDESGADPVGPSQDRAVKRESKLTLGGFIYIGVTVFLAVGAVNSQNNLLFWLFGVAIATVFVSGLFSGNALMKTRLHARAMREVHAGQRVRLRYSISNQSILFPLFACLVSEESKPARQAGKFTPASVVHIGPNSTGVHTGSFIPHQRGRLVLRDIRLSTRFPFGLLQKSLIFKQPRSLLVLPYPLRLRSDLLTRVQAPGNEVLRRSVHAGSSNEFWGLREYRPGDPRRRIAWRHSAKRDQLVVIEHAESYSLRVWLVIVEPGRDEPDAVLHAERAIAIAGSLFEANAKRSLPIGLWYPQRSVRSNPSSGRAHAGRMLRTLAMLDLHEEPSVFLPIPARTRDRVIVIQRGDRLRHPISAARVIDTDKPESWLVHPDSLPKPLGGVA